MKTKSWTRYATVAAVAIFLLAPARDAAALCQNGSASQSVSGGNGTTLVNVLAGSTTPCTVMVGPGTYTAPSGGQFNISSGITVRSTNGAAATVLVTSGQAVVSISPIAGRCPSGAGLDGLTLVGNAWGVFVGADVNYAGCTLNQVTGVTLRNLVINIINPVDGHGINFHSVQGSVIDSVTINSAYANGIYIEAGSNNNIVMNSTIAGTMSQHGIAVQGSSDNVIVGNTIGVVSSFDGIILNSNQGPGSSRNRIERNTISGHQVDGIVLHDSSNSNYVGLNTAVSNAYTPGSSTPPSRNAGTGIWVNQRSNANYLFGNDVSGSPENGIDILKASSTFLVANSVHGNWQGGVWVAYDAGDPAATTPRDTVLQGNYLFFNSFSGQLFFQGTANSEASYNYVSGAAGTRSAALASKNTVGLELLTTDSTNLFENIVSEIGSRAVVFSDTHNSAFFRNTFLRGTNDPNATDGLNGLAFVCPPADVRWDGGSFIGGNHWSEFASATGNPDFNHPYTGFGCNTGAAPYADRFPYGSESRQNLAIPNSVIVAEPGAGSVLAAGTIKTIHWVGRGCTLVDLYYRSGAVGSTLMASAQPNTGFYFWRVPAVAIRGDYSVEVVCTNRDGAALGVSGSSSAFTIASADLVLLNPGRATRAANNGVVRVAWKASAAVTAVNIFVKTGAGAETQVASNVAGTSFADVTLPGSVSTSSQVTVRIQGAGGTGGQDSVDGHFMARGATPSFNTNLAGQTLQIGSVRILEWTGVSSSSTVDLDLVGAIAVPIAKNLADFGTYTWFVPDASLTGAAIRATFKDVNGTTVGTAVSGAFNVARNPGAPTVPSNTAAARQEVDGDGRTDLALFRPSNGTWYINGSSTGYNAAASVAVAWGQPGDVPISADFDGDGKIELAVFRPVNGTWYVRYSKQGYSVASHDEFAWGQPGDIPVAGDFDGDGKTDLVIFRPASGTWYVRYSSLGYAVSSHDEFAWGQPGDTPIVGDFDGDGKTDLTVYRPSNGTWYVRYSSLGYAVASYEAFQWGSPGDIPVAANFDGDGRTEITVFRPASGEWFIRYSSLGYSTASYGYFVWGLAGDVPIATEFDGDSRTELTVFRPSTGEWFIRYSSLNYDVNSYGVYRWGAPGDSLLR